jgi:hypothetical protein
MVDAVGTSVAAGDAGGSLVVNGSGMVVGLVSASEREQPAIEASRRSKTNARRAVCRENM